MTQEIQELRTRLDELERQARREASRTATEHVLVIGDLHAPFTHPGYLDFCRSVQERFGCGFVVQIGDEIDGHAFSFHEHDPDGMSPGDEVNAAMAELKRWYAAFPECTVLVGNHGALPYRKLSAAGLPKRFLKAYEEIWEAPPGWTWHDEYRRDGVLYVHGTGTSGQNAAIKRAVESRCSVVMGHAHSYGGVQYHSNGRDMIFGMNVGCGIDASAYAMAYSKPFVRKPTLGCGVVLRNGTEAHFVPMPA